MKYRMKDTLSTQEPNLRKNYIQGASKKLRDNDWTIQYLKFLSLFKSLNMLLVIHIWVIVFSPSKTTLFLLVPQIFEKLLLVPLCSLCLWFQMWQFLTAKINIFNLFF